VAVGQTTTHAISLETAAAAAAGGALLTVLDIHFEAFPSTEESVGRRPPLHVSHLTMCCPLENVTAFSFHPLSSAPM
jgi:hypothetical protein